MISTMLTQLARKQLRKRGRISMLTSLASNTSLRCLISVGAVYVGLQSWRTGKSLVVIDAYFEMRNNNIKLWWNQSDDLIHPSDRSCLG